MYWLCVLYHCHRVLTQLQLTNISYHIFVLLVFLMKFHGFCILGSSFFVVKISSSNQKLCAHLTSLRNAPRIFHLILLDSIVPTVFFLTWSCSIRNSAHLTNSSNFLPHFSLLCPYEVNCKADQIRKIATASLHFFC